MGEGVGCRRDRGGAGLLFPLTRYGGLDHIGNTCYCSLAVCGLATPEETTLMGDLTGRGTDHLTDTHKGEEKAGREHSSK